MDLSQQSLPIIDATSEGRLAIALHLKLLAALHSIGKLSDEDLATVGSAIIAELQGEQQRFEAWSTIEALVPDFKRPKNAEG